MRAPSKDDQKAASPDSVLALLKEGNERFVAGKKGAGDLLEQVEATKGGQAPLAAIVGCIDSRVSPEYAFDQPIGAIFAARLAGNVINGDVLGSLEFACKVAGSKLVVVLGHERCGAVMGACDGVEMGNLTGLLDKIKPAIDRTMPDLAADQRNSKNADFVHEVGLATVHVGLEDIRSQSAVLKEMEDAGEIRMVGAVYDVATGAVKFID